MTEEPAVEESGLLLRIDGGFVLDRDAGGRLRLELGRVPVDEVGKRVRIVGRRGAGDVIEVDGVALA